MLRLVYSNRPERLLEALVADLDEARRRPGASPFDPTHLVVPDACVEAAVRLGIARHAGIAANLRVHPIGRLAAALADDGAAGLRVVDGPALEGLLLAALLDDALLGRAELAPVRAYLGALGDEDDAVEPRRHQLALELGRLFDAYADARPELLESWRRGGRALEGTPFAQVERWQRRLWLALFGAGGLLERRCGPAERWVTAEQLGGGDRAALAALALPARLHVFAPSFAAPLPHRLLGALARRTEVRVYALNPCEEFWEDVAGGPVDAATAGDADAPALRRWGRAGREAVRRLDGLTGGDFVAAFVDPLDGGATLLRQLQHDVLRRQPERLDDAARARLAPDDSVTVLACPSARREIEVVAEEIWRLVRADDAAARAAGRPPLRFDEIAVVVADREPEPYLAHVSAVFREAHALPHGVVDLPTPAPGRAAEALALLIDLPRTRLARPELLRILTHPAVAGGHPDVDPADWAAWCDRLGVVHGGDRADHAGSYIDQDILNWDQGLRRLALGAFMTGARSGDERLLSIGGGSYLPEELPQRDHAAAARLGLLARSLIADARFARTARLPLRGWIALFGQLVRCYLTAPGEQEEKDRLRCLAALEGLDALALGDRPLAFPLAHALAGAALARLGGSGARATAPGVAIASLRAVRAVPYRVLFVVGLGEERFPAAAARGQLDLRHAAPRAGDVGARERDEYLFLEALLGARERLYLSYVARDQLTGDPLQPSPVLQALLEDLRDGYLDEEALSSRIQRPPLRRHQAPALAPFAAGATPPPDAVALPEARGEAQAAALGAHLRAHLGGPAPRELGALRAALPPRTYAALAGPLRALAPPPPAPAALASATTISLPIAALRAFLRCPLQGYARFWLRLDEDDPDPAELADEPFATPRPVALRLLRGALTDALVGGLEPRARYVERARLLELRGQAPTALFGAAERADHLARLDAWLAALGALAPPGSPAGERPAATVVRLGGAQEGVPAGVVLPPLRLELAVDGVPGLPPRFTVEITGRTEPLVRDETTSLLFTPRAAGADERSRILDRREELGAFLDHALLSASGRRPGAIHTAWVAHGDGAVRAADFAPFADPAAARRYLAELAAELLSRAHGYLLPCEAVFAHALRGGQGSVADCVAEIDERWPRHSSRYGPIADAGRRPPPPEEEARTMIDRRFGPFLQGPPEGLRLAREAPPPRRPAAGGAT